MPLTYEFIPLIHRTRLSPGHRLIVATGADCQRCPRFGVSVIYPVWTPRCARSNKSAKSNVDAVFQSELHHIGTHQAVVLVGVGLERRSVTEGLARSVIESLLNHRHHRFVVPV